MKQNKYIRKCGPYKVTSVSQDEAGIRMMIYPAFPQYNLTPKEQADPYISDVWRDEPRWPIHRYKREGGGPSIFSCIALAEEFETFLNQQYSPQEVTEWKDTLDEALADYNKKQTRKFDREIKRLENKR